MSLIDAHSSIQQLNNDTSNLIDLYTEYSLKFNPKKWILQLFDEVNDLLDVMDQQFIKSVETEKISRIFKYTIQKFKNILGVLLKIRKLVLISFTFVSLL